MKYDINEIRSLPVGIKLSDCTIYEISENIVFLANTNHVDNFKKTEMCFNIALDKCLACLNTFTVNICGNYNEMLFFIYTLENYNGKWFLICTMYENIFKTGTELFRIINGTLSEVLYTLCMLTQDKKHLDIIQKMITGAVHPSVKLTLDPCQYQLQLEYNGWTNS